MQKNPPQKTKQKDLNKQLVFWVSWMFRQGDCKQESNKKHQVASLYNFDEFSYKINN